MPPSTLRATREFVTQLLNSLPTVPQPAGDASDTNAATLNPFNSASGPAKKQLLALHVLFPNEFLAALDLLDRHLVTRFLIRHNPGHITKQGTASQARSGHANTAEEDPINVLREVGEGDNEAVTQANNEALDKTLASNSAITRTAGQAHTPAEDIGMLDSELPITRAQEEEEATHLPQIPETEGQVTQEAGVLVAQQAPPQKDEEDGDMIYYVRSAQQRASRYGNSYDVTASYEVRLKAWNCSCPAFAFAAFPNVHPGPPVPMTILDLSEQGVGIGLGGVGPVEEMNGRMDRKTHGNQQSAEWVFGGFSLGDGMPPVCKHLLACVLVERCSGMFGAFVDEEEVSVEEAAAWAAGWGD